MNDYMESIIELMIMLKDDLQEMSADEKERFFKSKARKHNPVIPEPQIQTFWNNNAHRVLNV